METNRDIGTVGAAGQLTPDGRVVLRLTDAEGAYTIPYIQHGPEIRVAMGQPPKRPLPRAVLTGPDGASYNADLSGVPTTARFAVRKPGEYTLTLSDADGSKTFSPIGVGTVIAALGDSITEGYHGHGFARENLELQASSFPPEAVSADGRNFPQYAPTTTIHRPDVNTFQSWMTDLNNLLTKTWKRPVFIANEGWGGITTEGYLALMQNETWRQRLRLLQPNVWIIHLGVNDERQGVSAEAVQRNLHTLAIRLQKDYGAEPERILLASPCYDFYPGAEKILTEYTRAVRDLVDLLGLGTGPDFFAAYAQDRPRWYGADPVHPNIEGMVRMARLWHDALQDMPWS
mgnify:CR=1 FL=1